MTGEPVIDFWFSIGSTYSYLSVMRLHGIERSHDVRFNWRPFNVRTIMVEQNNRAFTGKPVKAAYMWRDIQRRAAMYGLPAQVPTPHPLKDLELADRLMTVAAEEGWCPEYAIAAYRRWFQHGEEPGIEPNLSDSLRDVGQDPARVIAKATTEATANASQAATDQARSLGIFGSPTFVVDREVFWGDDRLDDALRWRRHGSLQTGTAN